MSRWLGTVEGEEKKQCHSLRVGSEPDKFEGVFEVKKSALKKNPAQVARAKIYEHFNRFPNNPDHRRYTLFRTFDDANQYEAARLFVASSMWTKSEAWLQDGDELVALYSHRGCFVLFDSIQQETDFTEVEFVVCLAATTAQQIAEVAKLIDASKTVKDDQPTLFEANYE
jgi:hypothetical protein